MVAANKLVHLVEAFSTPWFLFSSPTNHHLVFFLLEIFNNVIQYQFDGNHSNCRPIRQTLGNSNLIYTIIRKRQVFYQLANLAVDGASIAKTLSGRKGKGENSYCSFESLLSSSWRNGRATEESDRNQRPFDSVGQYYCRSRSNAANVINDRGCRRMGRRSKCRR